MLRSIWSVFIAGLLFLVGASGVAGASRAAGGTLSGAYDQLVVDCVYGSNAHDSCAALVKAGFASSTNYGLGNSLTQAPTTAVRRDCDRRKRVSCAELATRVVAAAPKSFGDDQDLLCAFFSSVATQTNTDDELAALKSVLGTDAPPGVLGGLDTIQTDAGNGAADALNSLDGYVNPVCTPKVKRTPIVIRSDTAIGSFNTLVPDGGTLAKAYDTFGAPTAIRRDGQACIVRWKTQSVSMNFANLEGADPCSRDTGFFVKAQMTGKRWRTDKKLAVGDTVAKMKQKYPKAKTAGSPKVFGLIFRLEPASVGGGRVPRLLAKVSKGTIRSFEVAQSNAGE